MNILLHICCAPCLIYPFRRLKDQGFDLRGLYYNPNLYPESEYSKRQMALKVLSEEFLLEVDYFEYRDSDYRQAIGIWLEKGMTAQQRCLACWSLRLSQTAQQAKQNGFGAFSTTLLVSPYQNHERVKQLGYQIGRQTGINFYYEDFRVGFKAAQLEAKQRGIYRQKYCGCQYSLSEKEAVCLTQDLGL